VIRKRYINFFVFEYSAMNRCQCLTLKGEQCKLTAKPGSEYCWRHTECSTPFSNSSAYASTSTSKTVAATPDTKFTGASEAMETGTTQSVRRSRVPIRRSATQNAAESRAKQAVSKEERLNDKVDLGLVQMPTPLITRVTEEITDRLQEGDSAEEATAKTLDDIVEELGFQDVSDLVDLNEEEIDYFIGTILLHENQDKLADIVRQKIEEQNIRDPHARLVLKSRELLQELAGKFCRCIQKVLESSQAASQRSGKSVPPMTEGNAIAICRRGVINSRGLTFPRFSCKTYPKAGDFSPEVKMADLLALRANANFSPDVKRSDLLALRANANFSPEVKMADLLATRANANFIETPIFLPSKENKKLLRKHEGFRKFSGETSSRSFKEWAALGKAGQDQYLKAVKR
jgi:hypothetical protein